MNEELQRQLIAILKDLKDGASPAWQMLVEQRAGYYTWNGWLHMAFSVLLAIGCWVCVVAGRKIVRLIVTKCEDDIDRDASVGITIAAIIVGTIACAVAAAVNMSSALNHLARGAYPLGELIGAIR